MSEEEENKIIKLLQKEDIKDLNHDIALAPVWIQKIMIKATDRRWEKLISTGSKWLDIIYQLADVHTKKSKADLFI